MPYVFDDSADSPFVFDATNSFVGGVLSNATNPAILNQTQISLGQNVDIDYRGAAITRRGTEKQATTSIVSEVQGLCYFDTPTQEQLIKVAGSTIQTLTASGSTWEGSTNIPIGSSAQVHMVQYINNVYLSTGETELYRWTGSTLEAGSTFTGSGSTQAPANMRYITTHANRLVAAGNATNPDWVYLSDILSLNFASTSIVKVGASDGDPITGIASWVDSVLFVAKEKSLWLVDTGTGVGSNAALRKVHPSIGCVSHRSIAQITDTAGTSNDIFFLSRSGVHSLQQALQSNQQGITAPISLPIQDIIERINWTNANKSCAIFWNNRYILSVPLDTSTVPNYTLVFNVFNRSWTGYWTGWTPRVFAVSSFSQFDKLNYGHQNGNVYTWLDYVAEANETTEDYQDDGVDISTNFLSRGIFFGEPLNPKDGHRLEIEFFTSRAIANVYAIMDGNPSEILIESNFNTISGSIVPFPLFFPIFFTPKTIKRRRWTLRDLGRFRQMQFRVTSSAGKLAIIGFNASANLQTLEMPLDP